MQYIDFFNVYIDQKYADGKNIWWNVVQADIVQVKYWIRKYREKISWQYNAGRCTE